MQICFITGANRGIGLALTRQALHLNYHVVATHRGHHIQELEKLAGAHSERLKIYKMDVTNTSDVEGVLEKMPIRHIDVLINNAGVLLDQAVTFSEITEKTMMETFRVNVWGPLQMTQKCLPLLLSGTNPRVAHISSSMGSLTENASGKYYAYRSSKTALNMISKSVSLDFPQLTSIAFHPGWVQTEMGGPQATTSPEESAEGIWRILQASGPKDSGKFLSYQGREIPW